MGVPESLQAPPARSSPQGRGCGVPGLYGLQVTPGGGKLSTEWAQEGPTLGIPSTSPSDPPALTLNPMPPFLQHRQANMRAMTVKSPEKDTATTAREDDQESSLRGAPSAKEEGVTGQPPRTCSPMLTPSQQLHPGASRTPDSQPTPTHRGLNLSTLTPCSETRHTCHPRPGPQAQSRWTCGAAPAALACSSQNGHWAPLWPHSEDTGLAKRRSLPRSQFWGSRTPLHEVRVSGPWEIALHVSSRLWSPHLPRGGHLAKALSAVNPARTPRGQEGDWAPLSGGDVGAGRMPGSVRPGVSALRQEGCLVPEATGIPLSPRRGHHTGWAQSSCMQPGTSKLPSC